MTVPAAEQLRLGDVTLDLARQVVRRGADDIPLRPKTFDVLAVLVRRAGQVVSKQQLIDAVWGDVAVTDDSLVQCLVEIRRALGDAHAVIRTVRGRGYILEVPARLPAEPMAPSTAQVVDSDVRTHSARTATSRMAVVAIVAGIAAVAVGAYWWSNRIAAPPQVSRADTMHPEARRLFDEATSLLDQSRSQVDIQRARLAYARAAELDSQFASAYAGLANSLVILHAFGVEPPAAVLPQARAAARRAVDLDPTLWAAWQALGHVDMEADWNWEESERHYRRAVALNPSGRMNFLFAHLLAALGRADEALAESNRLVALDPQAIVWQGSNCVVKYLTRQFDDAIAACDRAQALEPTYALASFWRSLALTAAGRQPEALESALAAAQPVGNASTWLVGYVHARAGHVEAAREVLAALEARSRTGYVPPIEIALLLAALGQTSRALDMLERGVQDHARWMELLAVLPAVDSLRGEPRFAAIIRALRLPELPLARP